MVKMHYSFQTKECLYIAMEYCPGGDLRHFLDDIGSLEEEEVAVYFAEMITSVHHLHKMGYLHRDIKPENFLIDARGHIKLADFGLSKMVGVEEESSSSSMEAVNKNLTMSPEDLLSRRSRLSLLPGQNLTLSQQNTSKNFRKTVKIPPGGVPQKDPAADRSWQRRPSIYERSGGRVASINPNLIAQQNANKPQTAPEEKKEIRRQFAYSVVGSPHYMSPEVTAGLNEGPKEGYSVEVDWWSLGCVFWEMLLGVPPIQGETPDEVFDLIINWSNILPALLEQYKAYMTNECFDLLTGFLCNRSKRRGSDINYFKQHSFFKNNGIEDWAQLHEMTPPFVPQPKNLDDDDEM